MSVNIVIDSRENSLKSMFVDKNINHSIEYLDLGDIILKRNCEVIVIIERKTTEDLYSSIQDGRFRDQKYRLKQNFKDNQIMYIIEGGISETQCKYRKNYKSIIYGSILNCMYRDNLKVLKTCNLNETFETILNLAKKIDKNPEFFDKDNDCANSIPKMNFEDTIKLKKKDNLTPEKCSLIQLCQIPGVSLGIGSVILEKYKSLSNLILEYNKINDNKESEVLLENIKYKVKNDKERRVGPTVSKRIYEFLKF